MAIQFPVFALSLFEHLDRSAFPALRSLMWKRLSFEATEKSHQLDYKKRRRFRTYPTSIRLDTKKSVSHTVFALRTPNGIQWIAVDRCGSPWIQHMHSIRCPLWLPPVGLLVSLPHRFLAPVGVIRSFLSAELAVYQTRCLPN